MSTYPHEVRIHNRHVYFGDSLAFASEHIKQSPAVVQFSTEDDVENFIDFLLDNGHLDEHGMLL